jgi:sugar phosphate isomerase/epimerase
MVTRTGSFPIGVRRGWSDWQKKDLAAFLAWLKYSGFEAVDLMNLTADDLRAVRDAGLRLGSADLLDFGKIMSSDAGVRREVIARNVAHLREIAPLGAKIFFTCIIPGDPTRPRAENYRLAVECFAPIAQAADEVGAKVATEGWPGSAPHLANLCCNPETTRAFIRDLGSKSVGVNYDPSHLIRLGVDHLRFLREFVDRVWHVHAKDTELLDENVYELGLYQGSAFAKPRGFGEYVWRYTIPGHGCARWGEIFRILKESGYRGAVSVELEDENFNGTEAGEKVGLLSSLAFLRSLSLEGRGSG